MKRRKATIKRKTRETDITVDLVLDGTGRYRIDTGMPFMDHMLELFARHSLVDLNLKAKGDLKVDFHHTVEDIGLTMGQAFDRALGSRKGIGRYGWAIVPMDEALSRVAVDLGGRPCYVEQIGCRKKKIRDFDLKLIGEFFRAFCVQARLNLHVAQLYGQDPHHAYESVFKGVARALRTAVAVDAREKRIPSSKGKI
jgi:imidazoleglycerol-phosphate dehydratase